jgi:hypothetical protein
VRKTTPVSLIGPWHGTIALKLRKTTPVSLTGPWHGTKALKVRKTRPVSLTEPWHGTVGPPSRLLHALSPLTSQEFRIALPLPLEPGQRVYTRHFNKQS